jgi:hypothetical protein
MLSSKKLFDLVLNNNYDELLLAIQKNQVDFKSQNRKNKYIIPTAIEYRSIECFELLVNNILDESVSEFNIYQSGVSQALQYYGNAPNSKNKYFIEKLLNKNMKIDENKLTYNLIIFNEFSEYILNYNPEKHLINVNINSMVYEIIFNYCLENNLLNDNIIKNIISKAIDSNKEEIIILIKNTSYINNIWNYYPNIIDQIFNKNMSNTLLAFFVNLYNIQKPTNIDVTSIINNILELQIITKKDYNYHGTTNKKEILYKIEKLETLLLIVITNYNFSEKINKKIKDIITESWVQTSWNNTSFIYTLKNENQMEYNITLLFRFIEKIPNFEIDLSSIDIKYYDLIKKNNRIAIHLLRGLKTLINELLKLNKLIPNELSFIKDNDTLEPFKILKIKTKRIVKN